MASKPRLQSQLAAQEDERLHELRTVLAEGWQVELPVVARPAWSKQSGSALALHLILVLQDRRRLLVLSDTPASRQFLAEHQLTDIVV